MSPERLVGMADQIGEFFASWPDTTEAREAFREHLRKFWDPRMRRELLTHLSEGGAPEPGEFVQSALGPACASGSVDLRA